ncbi:MAG: 3-oxoacyl-[acyl-carrier-protein] reductase, partial [Akkermansia sp.]|nr:3-oxoacyl-[acyl-carrier-protein] reductase [Akkermansia sp.]
QELVDKGLAAYAEAGIEAKGYVCDVTDEDAVNNLVKTIEEEVGVIDILVNNAGITKDGLLMRMKESDWDAVLTTNLKSVFLFVKALQRTLMKSPAGRIINISSIVGLTGNVGQSNYSASKAGVIGFTKSMAQEIASRKVTVNAIAPGFISTDMTDAIPEKAREALLSRIPLADLGKPEDIAHAATFLASDEARYITGQVIVVDGGMTM